MATPHDEPLSTAAARDSFARVVNRAAYGKERVVLTRRGKPLAAVVPIEDVKQLDALYARSAARIAGALRQVAANPSAASNVKALKGGGFRLRVGDRRVLV